MYKVLNAEERAEDEMSGRMMSKGSWGEQEEQRKVEREGRRGGGGRWAAAAGDCGAGLCAAAMTAVVKHNAHDNCTEVSLP